MIAVIAARVNIKHCEQTCHSRKKNNVVDTVGRRNSQEQRNQRVVDLPTSIKHSLFMALTHWGQQKDWHVADDNFKCILVAEISNTKFVPQNLDWKYGSIFSGNGLAWNWSHFITWSNADLVLWSIYVSQGINGLMPHFATFLRHASLGRDSMLMAWRLDMDRLAVWHIQCGVVIMRSIFSKLLTKDTP